LEQLTFPSDSFDLFITQDVMEHVFNPERALAEVMRVVRHGGAHVFTAPKYRGTRCSAQRARFEGGQIVHLAEPEYHGNPVGDGRSLVTWQYGDDFEALIWRWCGYPTTTLITRDASLGLAGEFLDVFIVRKIAR
jgi:SAM-dependent methyltransferase